MNTIKLIPMTDYVNQILAYAHESRNDECGMRLIKWYAEFIQQQLKLEMFEGINPLFVGFTHETQIQALKNKSKKSFWEFGVNDNGVQEYTTTIFQSAEHYNYEGKSGYVGSFHLKTIEDLCKMGLDFNLDSEFAETDLFD